MQRLGSYKKRILKNVSKFPKIQIDFPDLERSEEESSPINIGQGFVEAYSLVGVIQSRGKGLVAQDEHGAATPQQKNAQDAQVGYSTHDAAEPWF